MPSENWERFADNVKTDEYAEFELSDKFTLITDDSFDLHVHPHEGEHTEQEVDDLLCDYPITVHSVEWSENNGVYFVFVEHL